MRRGSGLKAETVVFDTWAWWEVLHATMIGERLARKYIENPGVRLVTPDIALVELSAKLARDGRTDEIGAALSAVESTGEVVIISPDAAAACGPLLVELRRKHKAASLADAVMLAVARCENAILVSGDPCFEGLEDVTDR
jgi:predicted nucleic acid-binding protein